jgi:ABC-type molybdenum transport system ATPase subunit/photorepair protein PhrA
MSPASAVAIQGVWKYYGDFPALRDISFDVKPGACLALLGRNGAGKTTLLRILAGLSRAARGTITILGGDARAEKTRQRIGILGHGIGVYEEPSKICAFSADSTASTIRAKPPPNGSNAPASTASATAWSANSRAACASASP